MGPQGHDSSVWHTLQMCPWKGGWKLNYINGVQFSQRCGSSFLRDPQWAETPALELHWAPRELTVVSLLASTIDMYLNHLLPTITQQRLFSETLQTALFYLAFSNLDVPLSPSSGKSRRSLLTGNLGSHGLLGPPLPSGLTVLDDALAGLQVSQAVWAH